MKKILFLILLVLTQTLFANDDLYVKTFGSQDNPAILFLHGGPGYNSANFEVTTAQKLADEGFFVIVYDREGEGRSEAENPAYTFENAIKNINTILAEHKVEKVNLFGHSFGGMLAIKYAEENIDRLNSIWLIGAPVSLQESFKTIIAKCEKIYSDRGDQANLNYINMLKQMDTTSIQYSSYCFGHAMQNGFYTPSEFTDEAKEIYATFRTDTILSKYAASMSREAPMGFWGNESYTTMDLADNIKQLKNKVKFYGIYGVDDGLYSAQQINNLRRMIGEDNLFYLNKCSHNVFIDRQDKFLQIVNRNLK